MPKIKLIEERKDKSICVLISIIISETFLLLGVGGLFLINNAFVKSYITQQPIYSFLSFQIGSLLLFLTPFWFIGSAYLSTRKWFMKWVGLCKK